jgi:lipopolysaccharide export system protein LptC
MTYKYLLISLLVIAVGFAAWLTLSYQPQLIVDEPLQNQKPDAFMENVNAVIYDKMGKVKMKVATPKMVHYPTHDTTQFFQPRLMLYRKSPEPWYVTANNALAVDGMDIIHFWEDVAIHHPASASNPATLIKTIKLIVHPNQQTAETNELITLMQPNLVVNGVGMFADMNTGSIKLLSQTRGEYAPNS